MINRHYQLDIVVENVFIVFIVEVMHLLNLNLLMLDMLECQLLQLVLLVVLVKNKIMRSGMYCFASPTSSDIFFKGRNSFPPQPLLVRRSDEQIEEEGGNEEVDSQQSNKGRGKSNHINIWANEAKGAILNNFIEQGNRKPYCHPIDSTAWEMEQGI
ncbi:MAG: hypothetical protein EZS28_042166, partial [Streblomastix strix]